MCSRAQQYWADASRPYEFVPVQSFTDAFEASPAGRANVAAVAQPLQPSKSGLDALVRTKYALSGLQVCSPTLYLCLEGCNAQD